MKYFYQCQNEECEVDSFDFTRPMSEYKLPAKCPECDKDSPRHPQDMGTAAVVRGLYTAKNGYGRYDASGREMGDFKSLSSVARSSTAKK